MRHWWLLATPKGESAFGSGKAREVPEAIRKATENAKRNMIRVPLRDGRTLHHDIEGHYGAGHVILRSAPSGTGIIAGGPMRAVFETLGVQDVVAKSIGSSNPHNMIKATFKALERTQQPRYVAAKRGKRVSDIRGGRKGDAEITSEISELKEMAEKATVKVIQTGSPIGSPCRPARDSSRARSQ